ncbi:lymphocyte antigen 75 [Betta splendens]|uniref:Lymphocyte antigen 75 n=1 Tax=Betta splendens TaxID=158456 RepID=A0A6P7NN13_BETSP|nr:lymphocyte antigen 75 [Betta splendens]
MWNDSNCSDRKHFMCQKGSDYSLIENELNWCQARDYCKKHFQSDLVSISNETQNNEVISKGQKKTFWIGLMHDEWKWEDNGCSTYREWGEPSNWQSSNYTVQRDERIQQLGYTNNANIVCSTGAVRIKVINLDFTWEQAYDYCMANHTRLLQIEDQHDQESVKQWLNGTDSNNTFWIGLRQSRVFGFWIWADKPVDYDQWVNDTIPEMPRSKNCGVIKTEDYKWRDENCWSPHPFLCEEDIHVIHR